MSRCVTDEQKKRRRELYRAWVAKNRDRVRKISRESKARSKAKNPEEWRRKSRERSRDYFARNRERQLNYNRKANLKRHYGMAVEEYESMRAAQGGCCAICGIDSESSLFKRLYVDHDHDTQIIRGLLCYRCNASLGQFGDNLKGLQKVLDYLKHAESYGRKIA